MEMWKYLMLAGAVAAASSPTAASPTPRPANFKQSIGSFVERMRDSPYAPPGFVLVIFDRERTVFARAYGSANLDSGRRMTLNTLVYNASLTKAYTGLLASTLDADGTLPLETSISDVWPNLTLRSGLDPTKISAVRLLSHSSGFFDGGLLFQTNSTGTLATADVPAHLSMYAEPAASFRYSNFGPSVYSAMATSRTGAAWKQLLDRRVLAPLGLRNTRASIETSGVESFANCHTYAGGKWRVVPLKPTAILNAAGGMYASGKDTMRFMQAAATDGRSAGGAIPASVWRRTWVRASAQNVDFGGLLRDGYGLGWDLGAYEGQRYVSRSGGYTGCRSYAMFLPESGFGVALLSTGDMAVNAFNISIIQQAVDLWRGRPDAKARGLERVERYHASAKAAADKLQTLDPRLAKPVPLDLRTASAAPGTYMNPRLGRFVVTRAPSGLVAISGALITDIIPVSTTQSLMLQRGDYEPTTVQWIGEPSRPFVAFEWDGDRFERVAD